ncbi:phospholipase D-like domain-containing protein [Sphingobacterium spiritivorum]|uniref:phospholipase D-like domain-containing protein n=1 Tax=Sphingobacterium spiritivorum TaxID=258 RepID=UPI003DA2CECF
MISQTTPLDQQVLNNNKEIFVRIVSELTRAKSEILIAAAWFTDDELFDILLSRVSDGVHVELIIADNQENEKLDFSLLTAKGAIVTKIKNSGYGTMNQKYCIIDRRVVLHGSYNWSVNARKNNHESIIATDHNETVESLITNFNNLKEKAIAIQAGLPPIEDSPAKVLEKEVKKLGEDLNVNTEYEKVLNAMIAAEVSSFNRESLRKQGFDRSLANNGDHNILDKALDTLYNGFINDIDVIEDKKRRLLSKIDEQKVKSISQLKERYDTQIITIETEVEVTKDTLSNKLVNLKAEILINESAVSDSRDNKLRPLNQKISVIEANIRESLNAFVKPGVKWFELITTSIFAVALFIYLIVFYASAAYILLYSEEDAIKALKSSSESVSPQVFNPEAFSKAWDHGGMAFLFVCLFVFIPLIFASLERIMTSKIWAKILTYGLGLVLVDSFIAIKIAQSIHDIKSQTEINPKPWGWSNLWTDTNFYLVFILGAFGILLFKFCFEKLHKMADDRNPDIAEQRNKINIQNLKNDITKIEHEILLINSDIELKIQEAIYKKSQIKISEAELENLPMKKIIALEHRKNDLDNKLQVIEITTDIYKSHVENDNIPVSLDALKDRINIFLEGWNDFLHQEYSIIKASEKSAFATEVALNWENNKINRNSLDTRVKIK